MRFMLGIFVMLQFCNVGFAADDFMDRSQIGGEAWEELVKKAEQTPGPFNPSLIGGTVADPAAWPMSPWVGNCSSTVIGPRTLKTAAHCVSNGGTKTFQIGTTRYSAKCNHHASYRSNSTADWALCYVDKVVAGGKYEVVATAAEVGCKSGKTFLWTGYGCLRWGGSIDGKFRTGSVNAVSCPSGTNFDTITRGSVALCSGDSGGGGYSVEGAKRYVVGTNSRSNTRDTSYVSSTYSDAFRSWAKSWGDGNNTKICGVHVGVEDCRGSAIPDPQPDPDPAPDCSDQWETLDAVHMAMSKAHADLKACVKK